MDTTNETMFASPSRLAGAFAAALLSVFLVPMISQASWTTGGSAISTAAGEQSSPRVIADGSGGAIVAWSDRRDGDFDVYAQRVSGDGSPLWAPDGVPIATGLSLQKFPFIASDGAGGAVITWKDDRNGNLDIYAQRISANGEPLWTVNGVPVCTESAQQMDTEIVAHGDGTVVIVWRDWRTGGSARLFAQRLTAGGASMWAANGVQIAAVPNQFYVSMLPAGDGSYFLTWYDWRNSQFDVFAQRLTEDGATVWTANGVSVCTAPGDQVLPRLASDGNGGAILTWYDNRSGGYDIYAQRLTGSGNPAAGWPVNGVALCTAANDQFEPVVVPDGAGGAIVTWYDNRSTVGVYAQHVLSSGSVDPAWTLNGTKLNTSPSTRPAILPNGAGGAIIAWHGTPGNTNLDVVAQCITTGGSIQSGWPAGGLMVCVEPGDQSRPVGVELGSGQALIVWSDARADLGDIYAQRVGVASPNLNASIVPGSFSYPAVPRNDGGATQNNAVLTPVLNGNTGNTSLNWAIEAEGSGAVPPWTARLLLDGVPVSSMAVPAGSAGGSYQVLNDGPLVVRGGRHTLTVEADPGALMPEASETDNTWSAQFVWSPLALTAGAAVLRPAPPLPGAGPEPNSDGFSFSPASGRAWSVSIAPRKSGDDYDLRLYNDYSGSSSGYTTMSAACASPGNRTDFVIGSGTGSPATVYPAAVRGGAAAVLDEYSVDASDASGRIGTQGLEQWAHQVMAQHRTVDVYEGHFTAGAVYHITLAKFIGPLNAKFAIFPPDPGVYGRAQALVESINLTEDGEDVDVLSFQAPATGTFPIAVYRTTGDGLEEDLRYHFFWSVTVSGVGDAGTGGRVTFEEASPNPMTTRTSLAFSLPGNAPAELSIFDVNGRLIRRLVDGLRAAGRNEVAWDGTTDDGRLVPAGIYWTRFQALGTTETKRINVIR